MKHRQQQFYNQCLAYDVTKHTAQRGTTTTEMKTEMNEKN